MRVRILLTLLVGLFLLLSACVQEGDVLTVRTADPRLSLHFRLLPPPLGVVAPDVSPPCLIKGNISKSGEKIYHQPWATSYPRTIIDPDHGEKWFCTADEAEAEGWRQALN